MNLKNKPKLILKQEREYIHLFTEEFKKKSLEKLPILK